MAILIPSKNIYDMQYSPVVKNKITGISVTALDVVNNKSWQEYTTYPFANSLNVDTDGEWGMHLPDEETADEKSEYFMTYFEGASSTIYKSWQSVPFEITAKKHFTDITEENLFGNIRFSVSQSRAAGELKNGSWTKDEGLSGTIVSDFTYRDRYASGFTIFSVAKIEKKPTSENIKAIVQSIQDDYMSATMAYAYVYFSEITNHKITGQFLFPIGVDERKNDKLQLARYAYSSSITIKMRIGDIDEESITYKIGDAENYTADGNELIREYLKEDIVDVPYIVTKKQEFGYYYTEILLKKSYGTPVVITYRDELGVKGTLTIASGERSYSAMSSGGFWTIISAKTTIFYASLKNQFMELKNAYANGKETATIRCAIADYYENISITFGLELSSNNEYTMYELYVADGTELKIGETLKIENTLFEVYSYDEEESIYWVRAKYYIGKDLDNTRHTAQRVRISANKANDLPMLFDLYDTVCPMVYGVDRQDHPMSLKADGTAKEFVVIRKNIYYDGAVWQELSLIEA